MRSVNCSRQRLVRCRPVGETFREFVKTRCIFAIAERSRRMRGAKDAVKSRRSDSRREARHPPVEDDAPRRLLQCFIEECDPVTDALLLAERLSPISLGNSRRCRRMRLEAFGITLRPARDCIGPVHRCERLCSHRAVIREPAAELGAGARENRVSLVNGIVVAIHVTPRRTRSRRDAAALLCGTSAPAPAASAHAPRGSARSRP